MGMWGKIVSTVQRRLLRKSGLQRKTIESSGLVFHYAERGVVSKQNNSPSLLILHGFAECIETWAEVVQKLPKDLHVLALDLPGHGNAPLQFVKESPTANTPTLKITPSENYANFVSHFIRSLSLHKTGSGLHVFGHSMGGAVAAQLAAFHGPALRIRWLTLAAPAMITPVPSPFWNAVLEGKFEEWLIPTTVEGTKFMVMKVTGMTERQANTCKNKGMIKGVTELRRPQNETLRSVWSGLQLDMERFSDILLRWRNIKAKTQILWGSEDLIINVSGADTLKSVIPSSSVDIMSDVHHGINLVVPARTALAILCFREKAAREEQEEEEEGKNVNGIKASLS